MQDVVGKVEDQVLSHEDYRKAYIACLDWLANTKHRLQRLSDFSGDKRSLQDRLQQLRVSSAPLQCRQTLTNSITGGRVVTVEPFLFGRAVKPEVDLWLWNPFSHGKHSEILSLEFIAVVPLQSWQTLGDSVAGG